MKSTLSEPISVIIPTLNEANYIGFLLYSLSRQTYRSFEVILSDGDSNDDTIKIVNSFKKQLPKLTITVSKKHSPAYQRNQGAALAKYDRLLFIDADVILPADFLEKCLEELISRNLDVAYPTTFPVTKKVFDYYFYILTNWGLEIMQKILPICIGTTIFSTADVHKNINGFDEKMKVFGEDGDYVLKASKNGANFAIIKNASPYVSTRRFDKEGRSNLLPNMIMQGLYFTVFGKYKAQKLIKRSYGEFGLMEKNKIKSDKLQRLWSYTKKLLD